MANYYKNEKPYFLEVPLPTNGTLTLKPGEYVQGDSFARSASLGILTDKGAGPIAEITANPALLVYVETVSGVGNTIETAELADNAVTGQKLADNAVVDAKVVSTGLTRIKIDPTSSGCTITTGAAGLKITVP